MLSRVITLTSWLHSNTVHSYLDRVYPGYHLDYIPSQTEKWKYSLLKYYLSPNSFMDNDLGKVGGTQNRSDWLLQASKPLLSFFFLTVSNTGPVSQQGAVLPWVGWPGCRAGMGLLGPRVKPQVWNSWCGGRQRLRTAAHPISKEALCQQISAGGGIMSSGVLRCPPYNLPLNAVLQSCFCGNLMMQLPCWITLSQVFPIIFFKMVKTEILCFCALCIPPVDTRSSELHHLKAEAFSLCIKRTKI